MKSPYSYLLQSSQEVTDVAELLYPVLTVGPNDDARQIYKICKEKSAELIYSTLDFDRFKDEDGHFINILPAELGLDVKDRILDEYQSFLDAIDMEKMIRDSEQSILERVEEYAWNYGVMLLPEAMSIMMDNISRCASEYERMTGEADKSSLISSFVNASDNTLVERITGSNADDILIYRHDLIEYLEDACTSCLNRFLLRFFTILSCSSVLQSIHYKLDNVRAHLIGLGLSEEHSAPVPEDAKGVKGVLFTSLEDNNPTKILEDYLILLND